MKLFDLTGKAALITGASRGLGKGMALALAEAGADVMLVARGRDGLRDTAAAAEAFGRRAVVEPCDLADPAAPAHLVERAVEVFGHLDVLVTAAALQVRKPAVEMTLDDWDRLVNVNLRSVYFLCQQAGIQMIAQGRGKIINIASLTSVASWPDVSIYCATKGGIVQMTKAFALEWGPKNVQVNAIGPGTFHTELTDAMYRDPERRAKIVNRVPMGRPGAPEDLAGATIFLASDASNYMTGQVIYIDGGWLVS